MENRFIKVNETSFDKSEEKFPSDLTAATELQNGYIYTFRKNKYCIREMAYEPEDPKDKEFVSLVLNNTFK